MDTILLNYLPMELSKKNLLSRIGFRTGKSIITPNMDKMIEELFNGYQKLLTPKALYKNFPIEVLSPCPAPLTEKGKKENISIRIKNSEVSFKSHALSEHLRSSKIISVFACTIGDTIEKEISTALKNMESSKALVLDALGSEAVETLAGRLNLLISERARGKRFITTKRFSPGYRDWSLTEQKILFDLINPEQIGINLTEGDIMSPEKSITGVIGWQG